QFEEEDEEEDFVQNYSETQLTQNIEEEDEEEFENEETTYTETETVVKDESEDEDEYLNVADTDEVENENVEDDDDESIEEQKYDEKEYIEEKVKELLSSKATTIDGLPTNSYKILNAIISVNFEQVVNEIRNLKADILDLKESIDNRPVEVVTQVATQEVKQTNVVTETPVIENIVTEENKTTEAVNQEQVNVENQEETPIQTEVKEENVTETETNIVTETETNVVTETPVVTQTTETPTVETVTETPVVAETPKKEVPTSKNPVVNMVTQMQNTELPKYTFYAVFGFLALVFLLTCIIINLTI
ncbi:MAG: hypothetical protein IJW82_00630, partial [Clostridia bacterium]|nr:hypothetical protein [Clostridia bacterium]